MKSIPRIHWLGLVLIAAFAVFAFIDPHAAWHLLTPESAAGLMLANGPAGFTEVMKAIDTLEANLKSMSEKADGELKTLGKVSGDTKTALETLGNQQKELADRLLTIEQKGSQRQEGDDDTDTKSWGAQFTATEAFKAFAGNQTQKARVEIKNTVTNTVGNTFSDRQPGVVGGAFRVFTLEDLLAKLPTSSNAVDYVRENVFTNAAAETAESTAMPETSVTTTLVTEPVATIGHWIKISRQLANDNAALAAYINLRLRYGVNLRVENQIINGNGTAPNMSGFTKAGNFTAHGYTAASLTALGLDPAKRFDLIGKMIGDCAAGDYPADAIVLNPTDWWTMRLTKDSQGRYLLGDPGMVVVPSLFGLPVAASNAVTADSVLVGALRMASTFYEREDVVVDMSESDSDNFTKNLITLRATRRAMLAVERPAAVRYGDLTPA